MASKPGATRIPAAPIKRTAPARAEKPAKPLAAKNVATKKAAKATVTKPARTASAAADRSREVELALATFAHEVRTPLTGILAISDLLATSGLPERERKWAETIKASADHLASLATLFVDAARRGEDGRRPREDFFDLTALARQAGASLTGRGTAKGLETTVTIAEDVPSFVIGDPVRLRAALENLIDNAVKFTERGGVGLAVTANRPRGGKTMVTFTISDSGIGVSAAEIRRLFKPFSQANASITSRFGGAGLGLASVKRIAQLLGGDVTVGRLPQGTVFTLKVAVRLADTGDATQASDAPQPQRPLRLLGVEDNPFGRVVLNTILTELGHKAEFVGRGEDAAERITTGTFDAVLMDLVLPGISGLETVRQIRTLPAPFGRIPIVCLSGLDGDQREVRQAGANAFLLKPVSPRALATALIEATSPASAAT